MGRVNKTNSMCITVNEEKWQFYQVAVILCSSDTCAECECIYPGLSLFTQYPVFCCCCCCFSFLVNDSQYASVMYHMIGLIEGCFSNLFVQIQKVNHIYVVMYYNL